MSIQLASRFFLGTGGGVAYFTGGGGGGGGGGGLLIFCKLQKDRINNGVLLVSYSEGLPSKDTAVCITFHNQSNFLVYSHNKLLPRTARHKHLVTYRLTEAQSTGIQLSALLNTEHNMV